MFRICLGTVLGTFIKLAGQLSRCWTQRTAPSRTDCVRARDSLDAVLAAPRHAVSCMRLAVRCRLKLVRVVLSSDGPTVAVLRETTGRRSDGLRIFGVSRREPRLRAVGSIGHRSTASSLREVWIQIKGAIGQPCPLSVVACHEVRPDGIRAHVEGGRIHVEQLSDVKHQGATRGVLGGDRRQRPT